MVTKNKIMNYHATTSFTRLTCSGSHVNFSSSLLNLSASVRNGWDEYKGLLVHHLIRPFIPRGTSPRFRFVIVVFPRPPPPLWLLLLMIMWSVLFLSINCGSSFKVATEFLLEIRFEIRSLHLRWMSQIISAAGLLLLLLTLHLHVRITLKVLLRFHRLRCPK